MAQFSYLEAHNSIPFVSLPFAPIYPVPTNLEDKVVSQEEAIDTRPTSSRPIRKITKPTKFKDYI